MGKKTDEAEGEGEREKEEFHDEPSPMSGTYDRHGTETHGASLQRTATWDARGGFWGGRK